MLESYKENSVSGSLPAKHAITGDFCKNLDLGDVPNAFVYLVHHLFGFIQRAARSGGHIDINGSRIFGRYQTGFGTFHKQE